MKKLKYLVLSSMSLGVLLLLTGCVGRDKNGNPVGATWDIIGRPMGEAIKYFANDAGLGFGIAIILVTLIVRLLILPLGIYQSWKATLHSEKLNYLRPTLAPFQEQVAKAETQEEKMMAQQQLMAAQKEMGVSIFGGIGCLPLIIQTPFFSALFFAAQYTEGVSSSTFLGINLGKSNLILTAIVGILYYLQSLLSLHGVEDAVQREQMKRASYLSPVAIVAFSYVSPAAVTLYWVVGGVIQIIQQFIINFLIRPHLRQRVAAEFAKNPPKASNIPTVKKDVTPKSDKAIEVKQTNKNKRRNSGKQRSR